MSEVRGVHERRLLAVVCALIVSLRPLKAYWPAEDSQWSAKLVNTSSLCYNASVEDVNPEDPAIWQYTRGSAGKQKSFLQSVHGLLGGGYDSGGLSQV